MTENQDYRVFAGRAADFYHLRPVQKLIRRPLRMGRSLILSRFLRSRNASLKTDAATFWGDRMSVVLPEPVSTLIHRYGFYEEKVTRFLMEYLRSGDVFLDIGAHLGYFTLLGAKLVGDAGQVHAFEPALETFDMLRQNTRARENVRSHNMAAFSESGELQFSDFGVALSSFNSLFAPRMNNAGNAPASYRVQATTVDDFCRLNQLAPRLIKIDAETAELAILQGMCETLRISRPFLSIEAGDLGVPGAASTVQIIEAVESHGYSTWEFSGGRFVRHTPQPSYGYDNLFFCPIG